MRNFTARCLMAFGMLSATTILPAMAASTSAPADEYFGKYHLSILGIRNSISDMTANSATRADHGASYYKSALLAEDAIHQWQKRYPNDAWLPKMIFSLEHLYVAIGTEASAERAIETAAWLGHSYPASQYAHQGRTELANLSSSDDGSATTADSPAELGMLPGMTDTSIPPNNDGVARDANPVMARNSEVTP